MKIKFSFKKSFLHRIYFYLIFGILLPVFACVAIELRTTPLKKERFALFLAADLKPTSTLNDRIGNYLSEYNNKKVTLAACDPSNSFFASHYGSEGLLSDIVIMPQNSLSQIDLSLYIDIPSTNEFYGESNFVTNDGKHLGIYFGTGDTCPWSNDVTYKEDKYYAFVSGNSVHAQYFQDDYKDDQVMTFLRKVLNEKN